MFQVCSIAGRVFSGSPEPWRQVGPTSTAAHARRTAPVGREAFEPAAVSDGPTPPSATAVARSGVLAACAAAGPVGPSPRARSHP